MYHRAFAKISTHRNILSYRRTQREMWIWLVGLRKHRSIKPRLLRYTRTERRGWCDVILAALFHGRNKRRRTRTLVKSILAEVQEVAVHSLDHAVVIPSTIRLLLFGPIGRVTRRRLDSKASIYPSKQPHFHDLYAIRTITLSLLYMRPLRRSCWT